MSPAVTPPKVWNGVAGPCRINEHGECHGNEDIKAGGSVALKLRCACDCHRRR